LQNYKIKVSFIQQSFCNYCLAVDHVVCFMSASITDVKLNAKPLSFALVLAVYCSGDIYTRKIETEKRRLEELEKQIKRLQNTILVQRKEMGGIHANRDSNTGVQKSIRILENRLDKALVKFNEALAHNKSLREQIDNLRRERIVFDGIYHKLARELQRKKANMHALMSEANRATEIRLAAQSEMVALKAAADREQENFEHEWKSLGALIDRDRRAKENAHKSADRERMGLGLLGRGGDPAVEAEQSLRKRVTKGAWGIATDKASIHLSMEKVQAYEEAFAAIQKATRITDIDALVHEFVTAEDANFSLFNYVNDLANEIEKIEEQQTLVKEQLSKLKGQRPIPPPGSAAALHMQAMKDGKIPPDSETTDLERKKLLAELDAKLNKYSARAKQSEEQFARGSQTLSALKAGVGAIFARLGCGQGVGGKASAELLGGDAGVTESNIMQYLGLIEKKTNQLLQEYQIQRESNIIPGGDEYQLARTQRAEAPSYPPTTRAPHHSQQQQSQQQQSNVNDISIHAPSASYGDDGLDGEDGEEDAEGELTDEAQPITTHEQITQRRQIQGEDY
jgi:predicted  nucleic acid-binding Zn-ribbon protein